MNEHPRLSVIYRTRVAIGRSSKPPFEKLRRKMRPLLARFTRRKVIADFEMQQQCQTNWCWAAVAASVAAYHDEQTLFTQCKLADRQLGRDDCCTFPCHSPNVPGDVNAPNMLGTALNFADHHLDRADLGNTQTPVGNLNSLRGIIQAQIAQGRPLCVRVVWNGGGAHFVAIVGYDAGTDTLTLADSFFDAPPGFDLTTFPALYQHGGAWTDTYYTTPSK
jgi:hypothetical protein